MTVEKTFGSIRYRADDENGNPVTWGQSTSIQPQRDLSNMLAFWELESAQRLRSVTIKPYAIGSLIVVSPDVGLWRLIKGFIAARRKIAKERT